MRPKPILTRREALLGAALIWFLGLVMAYFAVNKPFEPTALAALAQLARTFVAWAAVMALANLLGHGVTRKLTGFSPVERLALHIGIGFGLLSLLTLAIGAVQAYSPGFFWALVLAPLPISVPVGYRDLRTCLQAVQRPGAAWLFAAAAGAAALLLALAPPTAWDSLVYHLTGPKLYLEHGGLAHPIDLPYLGFPKVGTMLYVLGSALSGPQLAQLLHLSFAALTLMLLPRLVRPIAPGRGGLAVAILVAVPSLWLLAGWAYVEWITAFWILASFVLIQQAADGDLALGLAGLCAGLALGTKYTAVWPAAGLLLVAAFHRPGTRRLALFAAAAAAALLPSLVSNWALTGNPIYPFLFDGLHWDGFRAEWFSRFGTGLGATQVMLAPLEATVFGVEGGYFVGHPSFGASIGPLLLGLAPLALLRLAVPRQQRSGSMRDLMLMIAAGWLGWSLQLLTSQLLVQTRLLFPVFPFLAAVAAIGYDSLGSLSRRVQFVLGGLAAFVLALTLVGYLVQSLAAQAPQVVLGSLSEQDYLSGRLGAHQQAMQQVNQLPAGSRVRFLWEPRSYFCSAAIRCLPDSLLDRWWHDRQTTSDADRILAAWRQEGVTHVLYYRAGAQAVRAAGFDPLSDADWSALDRLLSGLLLPVAQVSDAYTLYSIP